MSTVTSLWRYPIKSHGREALAFVDLIAGQTLPWDRHWAVTHSDTKFDDTNPAWVMCRNFMIGNLTPALAGIWAVLDTDRAIITLRHKALGEITFAPDLAIDIERFIAWVRPLCPVDQRQPINIVTVPDCSMTDTDFPSVSVMNIASHTAVSDAIGRDLELERWRGNIWLDGLTPWVEWDWMGREITIGSAILRVKDRIKRCNHPAVNPTSGIRDADTLAVLRDNWNHQDFGVYAEVIQGGKISLGDIAEVI